jgi:hypothetical protein
VARLAEHDSYPGIVSSDAVSAAKSGSASAAAPHRSTPIDTEMRVLASGKAPIFFAFHGRG